MVLSSVDFEELLNCTPEKHALLAVYLAQIEYTRSDADTDMLRIDDMMVDLGILS